MQTLALIHGERIRLRASQKRLGVGIALQNLELPRAGHERSADFKILDAEESLSSRQRNAGLFKELAARRLHGPRSGIALFKNRDVVVLGLDGDNESPEGLVFAFRTVEGRAKTQLRRMRTR
jgi:hypothetical protein